jgi:uncharacterized protein (TIGR03086 family)
MSTREHLHSVVTTLQPVVKGVSADEMAAPTPCTDFDVRAVANHMLGTLGAMRGIGASEPMDAEDPWGTGGDHMSEQWRDDLCRTLTEYAEAWASPDAWEGAIMDGKMPRQAVGDMAFVEAILHGWDLAKGSGQDVAYDDAAVERALEIMAQIGEMGRSQGAFGPEVPVPDDASPFDKVLAQAGRDPEWSAT